MNKLKHENGWDTVTVSELPECAEDLKAFEMTNEYQAAAAVICTLANFENRSDAAIEMLDFVMGPGTPNGFDKSFIKEQISRYPYVIRSYFKGAVSENDYTPESFTIFLKENPYSRQNDGYVKLFLKSSGADSERPLTFRQKASTREWFVFSDTYKGLMAGIREPKSLDEWD